nr:hypothetical protein [Tanacetum cinerariifolium]
MNFTYMALPPRAERHLWLRLDAQDFVDSDIQDFEDMLARIYDKQVHRVHVLDFNVLTEEMQQAMTNRLRMEHTDAQGFSDSVLDLDTADTFQFQLGGLGRQISWRKFILFLGLHTIEEMDTDGFRAYWIKEPLRRLCHILIAFTIFGRGQALEKVTTTDLFNLRSMDEGMTSDYEQSLQTFIVEVRGLTTIDIDELVKLRICDRLGDVVTWVAMGLERQQVGAAFGAAHVDPEVAQVGVQVDLAPIEVAQMPQAAASVPKRVRDIVHRLKEEVHRLGEIFVQ